MLRRGSRQPLCLLVSARCAPVYHLQNAGENSEVLHYESKLLLGLLRRCSQRLVKWGLGKGVRNQLILIVCGQIAGFSCW